MKRNLNGGDNNGRWIGELELHNTIIFLTVLLTSAAAAVNVKSKRENKSREKARKGFSIQLDFSYKLSE